MVAGVYHVTVGLGVMSRTWKRLICALGLDPVEKGVKVKVCAPELSATNVPRMYCPEPAPSDPKLKEAEVLVPPVTVSDRLSPMLRPSFTQSSIKYSCPGVMPDQLKVAGVLP